MKSFSIVQGYILPFGTTELPAVEKNTRVDFNSVNIIFLLQAAKLAGFKIQNGQYNKFSLIRKLEKDITLCRRIAGILKTEFNIETRV